MNTKIIRFFNYESAFDFYTKKIKDMKQGNIVYTNLKVYHFLIKKCTTPNRLRRYA